MGLLCKYFTAASNAQAAETIDWIGGPGNPPRPSGAAFRNQIAARPTVSLPRLEPTTWMGKLEEILTGRSFDDILQDPAGQVVASRDGGERLVIPLTARLQDALASIDDGTVDEVAAQWAAPDAYYGTGADAELAAGALRDLVHLARAGRERGETLYCWVCV
jgi:hypothetical protein